MRSTPTKPYKTHIQKSATTNHSKMTPFHKADVWVSSRLPIAIQRDGQESAFSPITCTLIHGTTEAVLVDTPISIAQAEELIHWIEETAPGISLKYIYITHGHGDH
jgi:glyoxylase-like metal-dependent hydrolase (beta-lactamase superfamily II)